jgi:predicted negative regulator of RcsB-dependent stress response
VQLAEQLKNEYGSSTYAQFAGLQLARVAVGSNELAEAQAQLRWVLGKADKGSDVARVAQLRLARVLAASGEQQQALAILEQEDQGPYKASYAVARGDILLSLGRQDDARQAYNAALAMSGTDGAALELTALQQKLQALNPRPARATLAGAGGAVEVSEQSAESVAQPSNSDGEG